MRQVLKQLNRPAAALMAVAVLLWALLCAVPTVSAAETSGKLDGMTWAVKGGVLSIAGKTVPDFTEHAPAPWDAVKDSIFRVELQDGITAVGDMAFFECTMLTSVQLPASVKTVGDMAFAGCEALESVSMPAVTHIGEYAFSRCFALSRAVLPTTLQYLGRAAFYRCGSLRTMAIPASVSQMGDSVFAYCGNLLEVQLSAPLAVLPEWSFYGCAKLSVLTLPEEMTAVGNAALEGCDVLITVYQNGELNESLQQAVVNAAPEMNADNVQTKPSQPISAQDSVYEQETGNMHGSKTTLENHDGAVIQTTVERVYPIDDTGRYAEKPKEARVEIAATLTKESGWNTLKEALLQNVTEQGVLKAQTGKEVPLVADISMMEGSLLSGEFLAAVAGKTITLRLSTPNGSRWVIDCSLLKGYRFKKQYDMAYTLTYYEKMSQAHHESLGAVTAYWVTFADKIDFPATVDVYVDADTAHQTASLYEKVSRAKLRRLQSVTVGTDGMAAYRLTSVNRGKQYLIALNVGNVPQSDVIASDQVITEGDWLENYVPITEQYIITDVKGFLGLTMKQFTGIVIGAVIGLAFVVLVIALLVNMLGKKKAMEAYRKRQQQ